MAELEIRLVPLLTDNYAYALRDAESGLVAIVDPSEAAPVLEALKGWGWGLDLILNTHHHRDHSGGNEDLKAATGATVIGPAADSHRIPSLDRGVSEGDEVSLGGHVARVIEVHGHTSGHVAFHFAADRAVFSGDTLFALGCGRLFEGTPDDMWRSLGKLRALPPETRVYCGHEYTASNCRFAQSLGETNAALAARAVDITALRAAGRPTIPSTIGLERATNPFLRADDAALQSAVGLAGADPVEVFAEIRRRKDNF
jgi:hydroxyacylglutathione hydrolase